MASQGGNKARPDARRSDDTARQNAKDEAVHRDPDIAGVKRRASEGPHARGRQERG